MPVLLATRNVASDAKIADAADAFVSPPPSITTKR